MNHRSPSGAGTTSPVVLPELGQPDYRKTRCACVDSPKRLAWVSVALANGPDRCTAYFTTTVFCWKTCVAFAHQHRSTWRSDDNLTRNPGEQPVCKRTLNTKLCRNRPLAKHNDSFVAYRDDDITERANDTGRQNIWTRIYAARLHEQGQQRVFTPQPDRRAAACAATRTAAVAEVADDRLYSEIGFAVKKIAFTCYDESASVRYPASYQRFGAIFSKFTRVLRLVPTRTGSATS